jgi:hypothetical protein
MPRYRDEETYTYQGPTPLQPWYPDRVSSGRPVPREPERLLEELPIGQTWWTVPWLVYRDRENVIYLPKTLTFGQRRGGTAVFGVTRNDAGYHCEIRNHVEAYGAVSNYGLSDLRLIDSSVPQPEFIRAESFNGTLYPKFVPTRFAREEVI